MSIPSGSDDTRRPQLGAVFPVHARAPELPGFAQRIEQLGYDTLWLAEDCFFGGGIALAATALAATERLRLRLGLMPAAVRNPAIAAMEIATLANLYPGRFEATFGVGVAAWMRQIDAFPQPRLAALGEVVSAVRDLLAGDEVTRDGRIVRLDAVALVHPPAVPPPVLVGATGPQGLALAGRRADGILLPEGCGPAFVTWALEQAARGAAERTTPLSCGVGIWLSLDDDAARARARLNPTIANWLAMDLYPHAMRAAGMDPDGPAPQPEALPMDVIDELAIVGDAAACAAGVRRLAAAGADTIALSPLGDEPDVQLERFAAEVLPLLRSH